ncbi:MAG: cell division protein ZapA [Beijerinckiaceae bacterium]|jgi:cell division protein ZapA
MATVAVTIAGRVYRMACDEGEEGHLQDLARHVDTTLATLRQGFGEVGDQRLAMMTAIKIADQLSEAQAHVARLEAELGGLRITKTEGETLRDQLAEDVAVSVSAAAERIERIARELNSAGRG